MGAFSQLRKQAGDKRDRAIKQARAEYAATLTRLSNDHASCKPLAACVNSGLPMDRTFTTLDIMNALEATDPQREWRRQSVVNHVCKLGRRGIVRRVKRAQGRRPAVYAFNGVEYEPLPFDGMTLAEVVLAVLAGRQPMRQTDLVVAMLEAGYQTTMDVKSLRHAVGAVLRGDREQFRRNGREWSVVGE